MLKMVVFDMDGVIVDSVSVAKAFLIENYPSITDEMYHALNAGNFPEELKKIRHLRLERTEEERARRSADFTERKNRLPLFPGIRELLERLHQAGILLTLNTNAYEERCVPILERTGIRHLFDFVATREHSTNKVEKFKLIREKYALSAGDLLFVTDALGDIREADEAGIITIAVTWGVHDESYFKREPHDNLKGIVHTVTELEQAISQNCGMG